MSLFELSDSLEQLPYFWFDEYVDRAHRGEMTLDEAFAQYQDRVQQVAATMVAETLDSFGPKQAS